MAEMPHQRQEASVDVLEAEDPIHIANQQEREQADTKAVPS